MSIVIRDYALPLAATGGPGDTYETLIGLGSHDYKFVTGTVKTDQPGHVSLFQGPNDANAKDTEEGPQALTAKLDGTYELAFSLPVVGHVGVFQLVNTGAGQTFLRVHLEGAFK